MLADNAREDYFDEIEQDRKGVDGQVMSMSSAYSYGTA